MTSKVTDHITRITFKKMYTVCVWVVEDVDGYILVDTAFNNSDVAGELTRAGYTDAPKCVVLTHCHLDHCGAAAAIKKLWDVPFAATATEQPYIEGKKTLSDDAEGFARKALFGLFKITKTLQADPTNIDQTVKEGDRVGSLEVIELPGHTPGQIGLFHRDDDALISADSFLNLRGKIGHVPMPLIDMDREKSIDSLEKIVRMETEALLPSHGPPITEGGSNRVKEFLENKYGT